MAFFYKKHWAGRVTAEQGKLFAERAPLHKRIAADALESFRKNNVELIEMEQEDNKTFVKLYQVIEKMGTYLAFLNDPAIISKPEKKVLEALSPLEDELHKIYLYLYGDEALANEWSQRTQTHLLAFTQSKIGAQAEKGRN